MTTRSRIAMFLSTSALCLGLAAAPSAFAAGSNHSGKAHAASKQKADKAAPAKQATPKHNAGATKAHKAR